IASNRFSDTLRAKTALDLQSNAAFIAIGGERSSAAQISEGLRTHTAETNAENDEEIARADAQTPTRQSDGEKRSDFKIVEARSAARYFVSRLNDAIANYKPPITRVSIEMHPKELGLVEVTLIKRGEGLIVSSQSSPQTIALLIAHSGEFRQSLSQIGYDQVELRYDENQSDRQNEDDRRKEERDRRDEESEQDSGIEIA
ncbi:MAG: flagellar hook-length control protein FliK, partial [Helicobacteraceae bacterium]|nr:flagellar hook-length control protein FliK [Helicobacteraceae bacterium]